MKNLRILWISAAIIVLDQITKYVIKTSMNLYDSIPVLGDFFRITYIENTGMAFGISFGRNTFFTVFAIIASVAILFYLFRMKGDHVLARTAMAVIFGGAIGNLADRLLRGSVVDFLDFEFIDFQIPAFKFLFFEFPGYQLERWPVFNVADIAITIGMVMLIIFIIFEEQHQRQEQEEPKEAEFIR